MPYFRINKLDNAQIKQSQIETMQINEYCSGIIQDEVIGACYILVVEGNEEISADWIDSKTNRYVGLVLWSRLNQRVESVLSSHDVLSRTFVRRFMSNIVPPVIFYNV